MMDVFERNFHYALCCICGIPTVTLEGTPNDWQRIREKATALREFDLDWWLGHLLPICDQFVRASHGDVDLAHWRNICKLQDAYGGDIINGWVGKLFPYLRAFSDGPCTLRNPILESGEGFTTSAAPPGLSRVPFTWQNGMTEQKRMMEAIGGLLGVSQDPQTLALRPKVGWVVREAEKLDVLLARFTADHKTFPGARAEKDLPSDLAKFFYHTNGAEISAQGSAVCRILSECDIDRLEWGPVTDYLRNNDCPNGHIWYRLASLPEGNCLAINTYPKCPAQPRNPPSEYLDCLAAICVCNPSTQGEPGKNPVIALSFTELLDRMLNDSRRLYWLDPQFVSYGDAEEFTRRK